MKKKILFSVVILAIASFWVFEAINGLPLLSGDPLCFIPTSYYLESKGVLINNLYGGYKDFVPDNKFSWYVPLFPWIVFVLNKLSISVNQYHISLLIIKLVTFFFSLLFLKKVVKQYFVLLNVHPNYKVLYYVIIIFAVASAITTSPISINSRPEALCMLLFSIYCFISLLNQNKTLGMANGVLIGLAGISSPVFGIYLAFLHLIAMLFRNCFYLKEIILVLFGVIIVFLCFIIIYPYPLQDLVTNMIIHSASRGDQNIFINFSFKDFVHSNIFPYPSFGILLFAFSILGCFLILEEKKRHKTTLKITSIVLLILVLYFSMFNRFELSYNLYVLSLLFITITVIISMRSKLFFNLSFIVLSLFSISFFINSYIFCYSKLYNNMNIQDFENDIQMQIKNKSASISYTHQLWPVMIKYKNAKPYTFKEKISETYHLSQAEYLVIQEIMPSKKIMKFPNYELVTNRFSNNNVRLLGFNITQSLHGYQYALYKRKN